MAIFAAAVVMADYKANYMISGEACFKELDKKYNQSFKSMTQGQRKMALNVLNKEKYPHPGKILLVAKTCRGKGLLKKVSRGSQNLIGNRISSKMIRNAIHESVKT